MTRRPPLTHCGGDVALERRLPDGRAIVRFLDRQGQPTPVTAATWPHELRGIGWHIAEIKRLVERLPIAPTPSALPADRACSEAKAREASHHCPPTPTEPRALQPRGFLHAHHTAADD